MNIQISVVIWTVICFVLLMIILKNLLFTPVLRLLDERNLRIEKAKNKKADILKLTTENEERLAKDKAEYEASMKLKAKQEVRLIQNRGKKQIDDAQKACLAELNYYREHITDEYDEIVSSVAPEMETAAAILAKNIISNRV